MKSTTKQLEERGKITNKQIEEDTHTTKELYNLINSKKPINRTIAIRKLTKTELNQPLFTDKILKQLTIEKKLYTKLEITNTLQQADETTINKMIPLLTKIGNNQYKKPPLKPSKKKTYPLPRDIIARTLGKINPKYLPLLQNVLKQDNIEPISEILDSIGFLTYYNQEIATKENAKLIHETLTKYNENILIQYKAITTLSAYNDQNTIKILKKYTTNKKEILKKEAERSLKHIKWRS
ncbi:MAG: hypothetical protein Q4Q23_07055 [Methanobacteriaceae archaeon]|nr:hypothetical protein [Methanobacteriaceae archaeon]